MIESSCTYVTAIVLAFMMIWSDGSRGAVMAADAVALSPEASFEIVSVVTKDLHAPLFLTHAGDGSGQLFVVEQAGTIRLIDKAVLQQAPFLDLRDRVWTKGNEQGLLGLAFHRDHRHNGRLFVNYNRREDGATVVAEYRRDPIRSSADAPANPGPSA